MTSEPVWDENSPPKSAHSLPLDIILFHMVDFNRIKSLPRNHDCTEILHSASIRVLERMFTDCCVTVETFMPRHAEFQYKLEQELQGFMKGKWLPFTKAELKIRIAGQNDNSSRRH